MSRLLIISRYIEWICFEKIDNEEEVGNKYDCNVLIRPAILLLNKLYTYSFKSDIIMESHGAVNWPYWDPSGATMGPIRNVAFRTAVYPYGPSLRISA